MAAALEEQRDIWYRVGTAIVGLLYRIFFRLRFVHAERIPASGAAILAGNHTSALDGPVLGLVASERRHRMTRFLVAEEFFHKRLLGWALRTLHMIPIARGRGDQGALDEAIRTIHDGALSGIFPEGRVNPEPFGELQRGRSGLARIAIPSEARVVPVGIWGPQVRWPKPGLTFRRPIRPRLVVVVGDPIGPAGEGGAPTDYRGFTDVVMEAIRDLTAQARALAEGRRAPGSG